jgi:oxygen-independent coproporphyrinogen-3 oxidase
MTTPRPLPAPPPLALYIHLPWCERKCPYCDFNSHERQQIPEAEYVEALLQDLAWELGQMPGRPLISVFIGGGTPSLFSPAAIGKLLEGVARLAGLAADAEITLEANPGSAEAGRFAGYRAAGVNRLSLGIQSFSDEALARLGRVHDSAQALAAVAAARRAGFERLNLDLMHGLPGQSLEQGLNDLDTAIGLAPGHLSWYQLTIEPNTVFFRRPPQLPVEDTLAQLEAEGLARLQAAGYARYEVSAYARGAEDCVHNRNYWEFGDYLGIGAGAHGKLSSAQGQLVRRARVRQPEAYLRSLDGARIASERTLSDSDRGGEFMLNALRLNDGVAESLFAARTGLPLDAIAAPLASLRARGLLAGPGRLATTALGLRFLDAVVAEFFPE